MRKIGCNAALAVLVNHRRQNLAKRIIQYISVKRECSALTSGFTIWPKFGGRLLVKLLVDYWEKNLVQMGIYSDPEKSLDVEMVLLVLLLGNVR